MFHRLAAVVLLSVLSAACVGPTVTATPPALRLDPLPSPPPANLPQGDYVLTNGRGEVLMEAKNLGAGQERGARVDLEQLDGTVNVVARGADGTLYRQTLQHTPGVPVRLRWDSALARFTLTEAPRLRTPRAGGGGDGGGGGY